jgi:hypothetical protein
LRRRCARARSYILRISWLPDQQLAIGVAEPFPAYELLDQDETLHTSAVGVPREPALYIFYRGDW